MKKQNKLGNLMGGFVTILFGISAMNQLINSSLNTLQESAIIYDEATSYKSYAEEVLDKLGEITLK